MLNIAVCKEASRRRLRDQRHAAAPPRRARSALGGVSSRRLRCPPPARPGPGLRRAAGACEGGRVLGACSMEESMEEEEGGSYEAMMDDQNHNNWEAADGFRQPPPPPIPAPARETPGGQLLAMPAVSVDRKGPKAGLPMGPPLPPEANGVIMMLKSGDAASVAKAAPAPTPGSTINIHTSTSKFCESSLFASSLGFSSSPRGRRIRPSRPALLSLFRAWVSSSLPPPASLPPFPGLVSEGRRRSGPGFSDYLAYKRAAWVNRAQPRVLLQTRSVSGLARSQR